MKQSVDLAALLFALWALISGIFDSDIHIPVSVALALLMCIHAFLYRKMLVVHFKGLRWRWGLIIGGVLAMVITVTMFGGEIGEIDD